MNTMFKPTWAAWALLALTENAPAQSPDGAEARLKERHITLPSAPAPVGNYVDAVRVGNLVFGSGNTPREWEPKGKVGKDLPGDQGYQAARHAVLLFLATR